ncbi:SLATT domain-containing protein [Vogesella sp. AC12]|uniref:SLATT domain-containing protein n=1 Tax=Vogesella sp. AC12 TaxID=2950550 RepID=UPI00210C951C|nr:SLATT domain-containing protein [Vogesella sp. AC12]MCQ4143199.1 SLATT domain-containing protein [Vogesella sp. AC12]
MSKFIQNPEMQSKFKKLFNDIEITADDRFNADRRLQALDKSSMLALCSASTSLILLSIIPLIQIQDKTNAGTTSLAIPYDIKPLYDFIQICMPIILLALSIAVSFTKYGARAANMHACALEINKLRKSILVMGSYRPLSKMQEISNDYNTILDKYENHDQIDHNYTKHQRKAKSQEVCKRHSLYYFLFKFGYNIYFYRVITAASFLWTVYVLNQTIKTVL